jgi:hypothetical protein
MKFNATLLISLLLFFSARVYAQSTFNDSISTTRAQLVKTSMVTLGGWAITNITTDFSIAPGVQGQAKYFWRMNGYFNLVNLVLAGMGYLNAIKTDSRNYTYMDNIEQQARIEKIYLFNFGLDFAYIGTGAYLRERGNTAATVKTQEQLKGYGTSIIVQGGFLVLMDGVVFLLDHHNTTRLYHKLRLLNITANN